MRIAFVNPEYPSPSGQDQGGIATYTYSMADACARLGHRVHVLVKKGIVPRRLGASVTVHEYAPLPLRDPLSLVNRMINGDVYWERCYSAGVRKTLLDIYGAEPLDVVEVPEYNGLAYSLTSPLPFPVIIHFHTPTAVVDFYNAIKTSGRQKQWYAFEAKALANAAAFRCPSRALAREISARYGIPDGRITLIRHPFDTAPFDSIDKSRSTNRIDILFVGRLERRKGVDIVRDNIQKILSLDPRIRFTFAGEHSTGEMGTNRGAVERALSENERKRVYFLGPVKREELPVLYCRSNLLCFPSLFENAPYTVLEAMAGRLPIVGARCGGTAELIRHGESGLLFNPDSHTDLLQCIKRIIEDSAYGDTLARQAYDDLKNGFQPEKIAAETMAFFSQAMAKFKGT